MIRLLIAASLLFIPLTSNGAMAQENGLNLPPDGTTVINFSATESRTMPQDLLVASLRIEIDDKADPKAVQRQINEAMTKALEIAKKESAFKVSTGAYSVYKYDHHIVTNEKTGEGKAESVWRGSQSIDIESKDSARLLDAVGKIQDLGFAMNNLSYTLSPEAMEKTRDELLVLALKKLKDKALIVAEALGKTEANLVDVNVDNGGPVRPMYKAMMARGEAMAMDAAMPAPVAEAGETDVTMTVSARALIK